MIKKTFTILLFLLVPICSHADGTTVGDILDKFFSTDVGVNIINDLILVLSGIALLLFLWGLVGVLYNMGETDTDYEKTRTEAKQRMVWGLVGLFVFISVWGILALLATMFGTGAAPDHATPIIVW